MIFKKTSLHTFCCFLHAFLLVYGFFPFIAGVANFDNAHRLSYCLIGLLLFLPIITSWALLRKLKYLWLYLPIGIGISVITGCLCSTLTRLFGCVFLYDVTLSGLVGFGTSMFVFLTHASSRIRLSDMKKDFMAAHGSSIPFEMKVWEVPTMLNRPSPVHFIWFVVQYVVALLIKNSFYWHFLFFMLLIDILICFICGYIDGFDRFVLENGKTANLPLETMKQVHRTIFSIALVLLLLSAVPALILGTEPLANLHMEDVPIQMTQEENQSNGNLSFNDIDYDMPLPDILTQTVDEYNPPVWMAYVVRAFFLVMLVAVLFFLILAIIRAAKRASALFSEAQEDEILFIDSEHTDERTSLKRKKTPREGRFSINMQIRRKYKKTIKRATKGTPKAWATPQELELHAGLTDMSQERMHALYEKARYSEQGCSKADL